MPHLKKTMKQQLTIVLLTLIGLTTFGQNSDEIADNLNKQSKEFLSSGEIEKAIPLLKQSAELGNAEAQYNLGYCYQAGAGVEQNQQKAIEWYLKSADLGFNDALYQMMMAYGNGNGVEQDFEKAFSYALKCAENDDGTCMFNLIGCYKDGMGTEKDLDKMLEWAIRLGKLDNPENLAKSGYITSARLELAYMYRDGNEIEQDNFKSYLWFLIYNEFKKDFSVFQQEQIIKEIQELENQLTADKKEKAQIEAEKILERPLRNIENLYKVDM